MTSVADIQSVKGWLSQAGAWALYRAAREAPGSILEIGSYCGKSTIVLALGAQAGRGHSVFAIDPLIVSAPNTTPQNISTLGPRDLEQNYPTGRFVQTEFMRNLVDFGVAHMVKVINLPSLVARNCFGSWSKFGLVFIDGQHTEKAVLDDVSVWHQLVPVDGFIAFHDNHMEGPRAGINRLLWSNDYQVHEEAGEVTVLRKVNA